VEDVQRVVAVRRAAEAGVPIPRAIERTRYDEAPAHLASHIFAALVEHAPVAVAALSGPAPLRVEFVNGALRSLPGAPRPGEELTTALPAFYDSPCVLALQQLFFLRPVPEWAKYRTPIHGLYLCGAGAHPGGGVTGAPGHNAAHQVLRDWKRGWFKEAVA
jgi:hypothetical protein